MALPISLLILCFALMVYVIVLRVKLSKRNLFIETTLKKIAGMEKSWNLTEMTEFLEEIHKSVQYSSFLNDKILTRELTDFIYGNTAEMKVYMHYTREEADARKILSDGFRFADSFHRTALPVAKDNLDLKIKHNNRKLFGDYLVIISISNEIANHYKAELEKSGARNLSLENILTEVPPVKNDNSDMVYLLSPNFIKGYVNYKTGEIIRNPGFNPHFNSPAFSENLMIKY